jgi:hypothetical protein
MGTTNPVEMEMESLKRRTRTKMSVLDDEIGRESEYGDELMEGGCTGVGGLRVVCC